MISQLEKALLESWGKDTTSDPDRWTPDNPAWGQCAVTACVVDDYIKSDIVWCMSKMPDGEEISHYLNVIDGKEYDATRIQFPDGAIVPEGVEKKKEFDSTREYVLSYERTVGLYETLKGRVEENLSRIIFEEIKQEYTEEAVLERLDDEILNWVDSDWADEFESEYDCYAEQGRGEAESLIIREMIEDWSKKNLNGNELEVDLYVAVHDRIAEHYNINS